MRPRSQMPRLARSTWRWLDPNGEHFVHDLPFAAGRLVTAVAYSGRFSANRLTSRPLAPYSSTADVIR